MAALKYTDAGVDELGLFDDPVAFTKVADQARRADIVEIEAATDGVRQLLAECVQQDLATFDAALKDERDNIDDRLDYYDYDLVMIDIEERDGAWFTPIAVESFCGEEVGFEIGLSIDDSLSTKWHHNTNETHVVVYELRGYTKKVTKMRLRYAAGEPDRERLTNITIKAAKFLGNIDNPEALVATGINPVWPIGAGATWVEIDWPAAKAQVRFVKLEFESEHASNEARIREIDFRVITRRPSET